MKRRGLAPTLLITTGLMIAARIAVAADEIEFRFNPPDGIQFVETHKRTSLVTEAAANGRTVESVTTEQRTRVSIRKTPDGYRAVFTPISMSLVRDGQSVNDDPAAKAFLSTPITYILDEAGQLLRVYGGEAVVASLMANLPAGAARISDPMPRTVSWSLSADWNTRFASLIGVKAEIGGFFILPEDSPLTSGKGARMFQATQFVQRTGCGAHDCVRLRLWSSPDGAALEKALQEKLSQTPAVAANAAMGGVKLAREGERLIDPSTMLLYGESDKRTNRVEIGTPAGGRQAGIEYVTEEYAFDYNLPHLRAEESDGGFTAQSSGGIKVFSTEQPR